MQEVNEVNEVYKLSLYLSTSMFLNFCSLCFLFPFLSLPLYLSFLTYTLSSQLFYILPSSLFFSFVSALVSGWIAWALAPSPQQAWALVSPPRPTRREPFADSCTGALPARTTAGRDSYTPRYRGQLPGDPTPRGRREGGLKR